LNGLGNEVIFIIKLTSDFNLQVEANIPVLIIERCSIPLKTLIHCLESTSKGPVNAVLPDCSN
jgi:hypothetical protein